MVIKMILKRYSIYNGVVKEDFQGQYVLIDQALKYKNVVSTLESWINPPTTDIGKDVHACTFPAINPAIKRFIEQLIKDVK